MKYKVESLESDLKHLKTRFDWWQDLREMDLEIYESVKKSVHDNSEMINLIKIFLTEQHGFNARKELQKLESKNKENKNERR
tara:strand:+ start:1762 stop:2007 length:246 start_codon:yes stop_codon:yes gene_type:complete